MPPKRNPLNLNPLQLKTLTLLQELARDPRHATQEADGSIRISHLPEPHGDHFHIGHHVALARDASGFRNEAVWSALERKGLARAAFPVEITLTLEGLAYDTGLRERLLHGSHH